MLENLLTSGFEAMGIELPEGALHRFRQYYEYLEEMNRVMNLTAISGEENVARLHFLDCASLLPLADFGGKSVIDVGTGAGFPGLVLKIARPDIRLTLLDSLDKRIGFLKELCARLGFEDVVCVHARAEEAPAEYRQGFDIAVSRAVAKLNTLSELCLPLVKKGGVFIAMKGPDCALELQQAKRAITVLGGQAQAPVTYEVYGAELSHAAVLVQKTGDSPAKYPRRWAQMKKQPL